MGKVILCTGERAVNPFVFEESNVKIYTMEELCYYIYHNIEMINEELFREELIAFIREELGLHERAEFIDGLRKRHAGLKDMAVSILCSTDYYTEKEIKELIAEIDMLYKLKPIERLKRNADILMSRGDYIQAAGEYRRVLGSSELNRLPQAALSDVLHNLAVTDAATGAFYTAAEGFREAYELNHKKESLMQYLFALKLSKQDALYEKELDKYVRVRSYIMEIEAEYKAAEEACRYAPEYSMLLEINELKEAGIALNYNDKVDKILYSLRCSIQKAANFID